MCSRAERIAGHRPLGLHAAAGKAADLLGLAAHGTTRSRQKRSSEAVTNSTICGVGAKPTTRTHRSSRRRAATRAAATDPPATTAEAR